MCVETKCAVSLSYLHKIYWGAYNKRFQAERYSRQCAAWVIGWSTDKWVAVNRSAPFSQSKTRNVAVDGAQTLEVPESVWLDRLFLLLTVFPEKSAAERCWMVALTGRCGWESCRASGASITKRKKRVPISTSSYGATGWEHRINLWRSGSAGFAYTGWNTSSQ